MAQSYNRRINLYINGKEVRNDIASIRKEYYKQLNALKRMEVGSKEYNEQLQKVGKLKGTLDKHNRQIRETSKQWDKSSNAAKRNQGILGKLKGAAGGLLPAFGFAAIIGGALKAAKAIFNVYQATAKARREAERLTGLSGQPLADFTAGIQATAKTFNQDFNEVLVGVNSISQTMGISLDEALQKVNDGFLTGADSSGEFMDIIKEYGPQFRAAGLAADESIALISQQVKSGIYSDKGIDAIKEATISIREMTPATRAAIESLGLSSVQMQQDLRNGTITVFDAIQQISNKMAELPPQSSEVGTAIADIFRGAGEDAGLEYITMLGKAETSLEKLKEGAGENAEVQEKLLQANQKLNEAWSELMGTGTGTLSAIKAFSIDLLANGISKVSKGISGVRDWFIELYNESLPVRTGFQYMLAVWQTGFLGVKIALQSLWEQLKLGGNLIKSVLTFDVQGIKDAITTWGDNMTGKVAGNAQKLANVWKNAWNNTIDGKLTAGKQFQEPGTSPQPATGFSGQSVFDNNQQGAGTGQPAREGTPGEMESLGDPRIANEVIYTDAVLEQSQLRQRILDKEQEAAEQRAENEKQLQQQKRDAYLSTLDTIIGVFGEESRIGKAALLAKQAYAIAETIINIAKGTGQTAAAAPFPANIPLIVGFVAQVAGLIGTIKSATAKTKEFAVGGYTSPGGKLEPAGIVHAGEWVAPKWMNENPAIAPIIAYLENIRQKRIYASEPIQAFAEGGFVSLAEKVRELNKVPNGPLWHKIAGSIMDEKQNAILTDLASRNGAGSSDGMLYVFAEQQKKTTQAIEKNTEATERLMQWQPSVSVELIEKQMKRWNKINEQRGLAILPLLPALIQYFL